MPPIKLRSSHNKNTTGIRLPPSAPSAGFSTIPRYSFKNAPTPKTPTQEAITIDMDDVRRRIDSLLPYTGTSIKDLKGDTAENFRSLVRYVQVLHDTDVYKTFFDEIQKKMGPAVANKPLEPGTVGAYFTGCLTAPNLELNGQPPLEYCSAVCAGSMPAPSPLPDSILGTSSEFCKYTVVLATPENGGYKFTTLSETPDKSRIIVYVDLGNSKAFSGFTDEEKALLQRFGAKEINLIRYTNGQYTQLLGGFRQLQEVPARINEIPNPGITETTTSGGRALTIILLILLLVIAVFIGWKIWKSNN